MKRLFAAATLLLAFCALSGWVFTTGMWGDQYIQSLISGKGYLAARTIGLIVSAPAWLALLLALSAWLWYQGFRRLPVVLVLTYLSGEALVFTLKSLFDKVRPAGAGLDAFVATASYPSGQVTRATVVALFLVIWFWATKDRRWLGVLAATTLLIGIGLARIALNQHWPSDVLAGYLLGASWAFLWSVAADSRFLSTLSGRDRVSTDT